MTTDEQQLIEESVKKIFDALATRGVNTSTLTEELTSFLQVARKGYIKPMSTTGGGMTATEAREEQLGGGPRPDGSYWEIEPTSQCPCEKCHSARVNIQKMTRLMSLYSASQEKIGEFKLPDARRYLDEPAPRSDNLKRKKRGSLAAQYMGFGSWEEYELTVEEVWKLKPVDGNEVFHPNGRMVWHEEMKLLLPVKNPSSCKCGMYRAGEQCVNCANGLFHEDM